MRRCAILVSLLCASCVVSAENGSDPAPDLEERTSAIVGGSLVPPGAYPDTVAVLGRNGSCTGTLIAPTVVLTAGHCADIDPVQVIANTTDYSQDGGVRAHVAKTTAYPGWQTSYDAAVLVLASSIETVEPRKVGASCTFDGFERETPVRLVGFGATDTMGEAANTELRQAMTAVTDPFCMEGKGCKHVLAPGGEFVAGGTGDADSCFGDSGGPVFLDTPNGPVLVGTVSRGVDGAATPCGGGGIYVRADKLIEWIEQTAGTPIEQDQCEGVAYNEDDTADAADELGQVGDEVGCSATGGGGGLALLAALGLVRRRRK